ncbi:MAG: type II secretion system protein [Rhodoferax sp.]
MPSLRASAGFGLVEMAVAIALLALLAGLGLQTLRASQDLAATTETRTRMDQARKALLSFLRSNGRLPCPDVAATPTGLEPASCNTIAGGYGVLPWATLGLPKSAVLDAWSNFFTYRLSVLAPAAAAPGAPAVPRGANNLQNWSRRTATGFNIGSFVSPNTGGFRAIQVDERSPAGVLSTVGFHAVATLVSHGKTGAGARSSQGVLSAAAMGADETVNATATNPARVIQRGFTENSAATGGVYDDLVVYITPQELLQPLMDDKTLKGICNAYCTPSPGPSGCAASAIPVGNATMTCP